MKKSLSQKGMSLVEIMIVAAILGFLGLAVSTTFTDIFRMQSRISGNDEANEFAASLGRFLFSESTCSEALVGKSFPVNKSDNLVLPKYVGYNAKPGGSLVKEGERMGNKLKIKSLTIKDKKMPVEQIKYEDKTVSRYLAEITLVTESQVGKKWNLNPPRVFEFPVLVNASNKIVRCMTSSSTKDACAALGSELDPATGRCKPQAQCFYEGSFTVHACNGKVSCTPDPGGCADGSQCKEYSYCTDRTMLCPTDGTPCPDGKPCTGLIPDMCKNGKACEAGTTCPNSPSDCPPNVPNPLTRTISCPSGNKTKSLSGESAWSQTVVCGKKCTMTLDVKAQYYICLKCQ